MPLEEHFKKNKEHIAIWIGVAGGGFLLYFALKPSQQQLSNAAQQNMKHPTQTKPFTEPNPNQGSLDAAFIQAKEAAIEAYDQTVLGEKASHDQLTAIQNEDLTQKTIAFNQDATQLKETGLTTSAAENIAQTQATSAQAIAGTEASAAENIASQQASAMGQYEHSQQQNSLWNSIFGFLGNIGSWFGI